MNSDTKKVRQKTALKRRILPDCIPEKLQKPREVLPFPGILFITNDFCSASVFFSRKAVRKRNSQCVMPCIGERLAARDVQKTSMI